MLLEICLSRPFDKANITDYLCDVGESPGRRSCSFKRRFKRHQTRTKTMPLVKAILQLYLYRSFSQKNHKFSTPLILLTSSGEK